MKIKVGIGVLILPIFLFLAKADMASLLLFLSAVFFHELGHVIMIAALKKKICRITLEPLGARIVLGSGISYGQELLIALSGPTASFLLFFALRSGEIADYSLFLGLINLLPVSTLDGGRALECAVSYFLGPSAGEKAVKACGRACIMVLWLFAVYLVLRYDGGFGLFAFSCVLIITTMKK